MMEGLVKRPVATMAYATTAALATTATFATVTFTIAMMWLSVAPSSAAQLIMMEQDGCSWCERWHREIGSIYPKTDEADLAPLRIQNIHEPWPEDLEKIHRAHFTPTFVLVNEGVEIGRLRGYGGDEFFWYLLGELLEKLPGAGTTATR